MVSAETRSCIEARLTCCSTCLGMASNHFRLMLACAEVRRSPAPVTPLGSPRAGHLAPECAEVATKCAESRDGVGDGDACAAARRPCAAFCSRRG